MSCTQYYTYIPWKYFLVMPEYFNRLIKRRNLSFWLFFFLLPQYFRLGKPHRTFEFTPAVYSATASHILKPPQYQNTRHVQVSSDSSIPILSVLSIKSCLSGKIVTIFYIAPSAAILHSKSLKIFAPPLK